jgi:predicted AlkP superfamily pyrophosphatase or phosphodiesterase
VYHWGTDNAGHYFGPDSDIMYTNVKALDAIIAGFIQVSEAVVPAGLDQIILVNRQEE